MSQRLKPRIDDGLNVRAVVAVAVVPVAAVVSEIGPGFSPDIKLPLNWGFSPWDRLSFMRRNLQTYAITAVTHQRKRLFQRTANAELLIATLIGYRDSGKFQLHGFVVMPDHVHTLISPAPDLAIERCVQLIKGGFSFAIRGAYAGEVWQDGYHAHRVTDEQDYRNQLLYIANNPSREGLDAYPHIFTAPNYRGRVDPHPSG